MSRFHLFYATAVLAITPAAALAETNTGGTAAAVAPVSEVVVTATRAATPELLDQTGSSVTVVQAVDLKDRQIQLVSDVLRDVPGVEVNRAGAVGSLTQVRMRGAEGNHTLMFIDGIKASDPYHDEYDFSTLIADDVARVEVVRGEQSALYGSDAIGGVINYITSSGSDAPGVRTRIEAGSFGTYEGSARAAGVSGPFDYAFAGSYYDTGGYVVAPGGSRDIGSEITTLTGKVDYHLTPNLTLRAVGRYNHTYADQNDQDYAVTGNAVDSGGHYDNTAFYGLLGAQLSALEDRWINDLSVQLAHSERNVFDDSNTRAYGDTGLRDRASYVSTFKIDAESAVHTLIGAVDWERDRFSDPNGVPGDRHISNWGLVGEYQLVLDDRATFGAAVRRDLNDPFGDTTTYHLDAGYLFPSGARIHAATGTGVKAPGPYELYGFTPPSPFYGGYVGNPNLKPETSRGWEAGVGQELLDGRVRLDATYFDSTLKDEISTNSAVTPNTSYNLPTDSTRRGVELSAEAAISPQWRATAAYTYLDAKQLGVEEVRRPKTIASVNVAWRSADERFGANATVRYNSAQTDTNFATYGTVTLKDYTLVNLGADFRITKALQVYGRVENLFDVRYQEAFGFNAPDRAAYLGVRAGF